MAGTPRPLDGLFVLDLGQIYQGPYAGFLLAMAGALVVKIEPPAGEPLRRRAAARGGSVPMAMLNSNKKSLALDLKHPAGREVFGRLVDRADVLIENFAPGSMDKLGLGAAALRARNPRLVYAAASGYGQTGRDAHQLAMDVTVQAASGILHCTGFPDGPPVRFRWRRVLHAVAAAEGPERIALAWWRDADGHALTRDYFRVECRDGFRAWLFREGLFVRETPRPRWFLHGLFG